jgi:hypothetical protein
MRWPLRRRDLPLPEPAPIPVPLTVTVWSRPPILVTDTFGLPDVAGTRSLLPRHDGPAGPDAPRGRVLGAVAVRREVVRRPGWLAVLRHRLAGRAPVAPVANQPWAVRVLERPAPPPPSWIDAIEPQPIEPPSPVSHAVPVLDQSVWITDDSIAELQSILDIARDQPDPVSRPIEPADTGSRPVQRRLTLAESRRLGISSARPPQPAAESADYAVVESTKPASTPTELPELPMQSRLTSDGLPQPDPLTAETPAYRVVERPKPASTLVELPEPASELPELAAALLEPTADLSEPAAELPMRAGLAGEWPKMSGGPAEQPEPAAKMPESADMPADLSESVGVPVELSTPAGVPVEMGVVAERSRPSAGSGPRLTAVSAEMPKPADAAAERPRSAVRAGESPKPVRRSAEMPADVPMAASVELIEVIAAAQKFAEMTAEPPGGAPIEVDVEARPDLPAGVPTVLAAERPPADEAPDAPPPSTREPARRLGLGAPLPPGVRRAVEPVEPEPTQWAERPPDDLMAMVGAAQGVDVSGTWVHRGTEVTARAEAKAARAFTAAGTVFLPDTAGPLTTVEARATLAHELTHVAQQRTLGTALPAEWTPAGQALESEAVLAERWVLAGRSGPPLVHAPIARTLATTASTSDGVQRQPLTDLSWTAPDEIMAQLTSRTEAPPTPEPTAAEPPTPQLLRSELLPAATTSPPDVDEPIPAQQEWVVDQELAERRDRLLALCAQRPANLDNVLDMEELAVKLYHRLRGLLRGELIVDRERAGLLTDFR